MMWKNSETVWPGRRDVHAGAGRCCPYDGPVLRIRFPCTKTWRLVGRRRRRGRSDEGKKLKRRQPADIAGSFRLPMAHSNHSPARSLTRIKGTMDAGRGPLWETRVKRFLPPASLLLYTQGRQGGGGEVNRRLQPLGRAHGGGMCGKGVMMYPCRAVL